MAAAWGVISPSEQLGLPLVLDDCVDDRDRECERNGVDVKVEEPKLVLELDRAEAVRACWCARTSSRRTSRWVVFWLWLRLRFCGGLSLSSRISVNLEIDLFRLLDMLILCESDVE